MARERRAGGRRSKAARGSDTIPQLPLKPLSNPQAPVELLNEEQIQALHDTSMRILSELGIRVMGERVLGIFERAGAIVDRETSTVRIDEDMVMEAVATAPERFTLTPRNPEKRLEIGGDALCFGLVAGPPYVHDRINGRRSGNLKDYENFIRLAQHFNAIHLIGNQVTAPQELPANNRHLDTYLANLTLSDLSFHCTAIGRGRAMDGIEMMAIARGLSLDQIAEDPGVITIISINSPRLFDEEMGEGLIAMVEHGQPVTITPFTLMGAMAPVTLPAALAQQNAEALFGVVLAQLVKQGAPVMYGAFTSNVDMRSGAPTFGTPENTKANMIAGQLARRYGLPYRTSNANTSNAVDLQAAYETGMATWGAVMGGGNMIYHAAGWLEGGLTASYEKLILDVEILQNIIEFVQPVEFGEEELGFEAIKAVDTGGHFFGTDHTMARYETAFYQPMLSDWTNYENWEIAGATEAVDRATNLWQQALKEYEEPPLDAATREALEAYVARRKEQIGDGSP
ncbi:trimethylamine methyltransferase family protein [Roseibium sp. MMSF_3544]|uniref:trimethylamine methyltransferase family protein n=1 Tax=unclassified Roseibium TaxID=2629323 RepID=UPI00273EBCCD|nr:trimethylamine methyltransferase family protein [Roseibium sp. MMSF_3544]